MKDATLTLVASRRVVRCDLERGDWFAALVRAGYDATLPTLFVLEGLMYYLSPRRAGRPRARWRRARRRRARWWCRW